MKLSIQNLFPLALAATLSYGAHAAEEGDIFVNLKCAATAQPIAAGPSGMAW